MHHSIPPIENNCRTGQRGKSGILLGLALLAAMLSSTPTRAAVKALSRANCLGFINESVTYDRPGLRDFTGLAISNHTPMGATNSHQIIDSMADSDPPGALRWRYYAGDVGDVATIAVSGVHSWAVVDPKTKETLESGSAVTVAADCNLTEW